MALFRRKVVDQIFKNISIRKHSFRSAGDTEQHVHKKINLENKVAVVTGGASGIGYFISKALLQGGLSALAIIDNDKEQLKDATKKLRIDFGEDRILPLEANVSDIEQMDSAFRNTVLYYHVLDIIVNNAGVMDDINWEKELKTNINGCVIGTLLGMQYMAKSSQGSGGTIVNVGSVMSFIPSCGFPIYTMTQFAIGGFSKALGSSKLYERTGVKIFAYCPGLTNTKLLDDVSTKCINLNFANEFQIESENCQKQSANHVANSLINILDEAKPGSLWMVENGNEPKEIEINAKIKKGVKRQEEIQTV